MAGASAVAAADLVKVSGTISRILKFEDDYKIAFVVDDITGKELTLTGAMPEYMEGMRVVAETKIDHHQKYGKQHKVHRIWDTGFRSNRALTTYLSSPAFLGIGKVTAKSIVEHFGIDTMKILDREPERISEVPGIGDKRRKKLIEDWTERRTTNVIAVDLMGYNLSMRHALRIVKQLGRDAEAKIKENPYCLIEIDGIGFRTADSIAMSRVISPTDPRRLAACGVYILEKALSAGHCYLHRDDLVKFVCEELNIQATLAQVGFAMRDHAKQLVSVVDSTFIGLKKVVEAEERVAKHLSKMVNNTPCALEEIDRSLPIWKRIDEIAEEQGIELAIEQSTAVYAAVCEKLSVITGGPGTGKTTVTRTAVDLIEERGETVLLMAPTGRAAKRLAESTGREAFTVHRVIGMKPNGAPLHDVDNPLECEVVVIDESSMLDILLMDKLIRALPPGCRIVMVGDKDQLPSVGPGYVLHDIIESNLYQVTRLVRIFRQDSDSSIVSVAHDILNGRKVQLPRYNGLVDGSCSMIEAENSYLALSQLEDLVDQLTKSGLSMDEIKVLTPMRVRTFGTMALNPRFQKTLNPGGRGQPHIKCGDTIYRVGDPVMQLKNDYKKGVFNGDVGTVIDIEFDVKGYKHLLVDYPGTGCVTYTTVETEDLALAYACTIHKSQGSEFSVVIMVLHPEQEIMLKRQIAYTGLTRARRSCIFIGTSAALQKAIDNNEEARRNTLLTQRLAVLRR